MFEFFLALFGGAYYTNKALSAYNQNKIDKINNNRASEARKAIIDKYFAPLHLINYVDNEIQKNFAEFQKEFREDLTYIYGADYETKMKIPNIWEEWYYSVPVCLRHLVLAKKYKKMEGIVGGYSSGFRREQAKYSIRLFKKINDYIGDESCKLTLCPQYVGTQKNWTIFCATFQPAYSNIYADCFEATRWLSYC